jgi:hypothetical protein
MKTEIKILFILLAIFTARNIFGFGPDGPYNSSVITEARNHWEATNNLRDLPVASIQYIASDTTTVIIDEYDNIKGDE